MKILSLLTCSTAFLLASSLSALHGFYPAFTENGTIKLAAQGWLCGYVTLAPKPSSGFTSITLQAERVTYWSPRTIVGITSFGVGRTSVLRQKYDWAGRWPSDHYEISCWMGNPSTYRDSNQSVDCRDVINIEDVNHDAACLGFSNYYIPLNMKTSAGPYNP
jgi:hypothetical protein